MKKFLSVGRISCPLALFVAAASLPLAASSASEPPKAKAQVQLLVKLNPRMNEATFKALLSGRGGSQSGLIPALGVRIVRVPSDVADLCRGELERHSDVEYVEPDYTAEAVGTANDPYLGSEWHLSKIQAPAAWDVSTGSSSVVVAVIDTGVLASHPDLAGKVLAGGYDFVANDNDPTDENGHGTAVSGTIAPAADNSLGVVGVSWTNPILPVRVLDAAGSGNYSAICNGITYAADRGAKIINLSLGGTSSSSTLQSAVNYAWNKNCVVVAAAGNNGNNITFYPAACTNVVAVSATNPSDTRPTWSNYGSYVDVSAPGENIWTLSGSNSYAAWSGTSFSSPVTSGIVALMASANTSLNNANLVDLLLKNSDDIGSAGYDVYYGNGRVNALRAVTAAKNFTTTADIIAPVAAVTSPSNGSTVKAPSQNVNLSASDNVAVTKISLYIDGVLVGSSATSSASFNWNTKKVASGAHSLQGYAYDAAGNVGASPIITVYK